RLLGACEAWHATRGGAQRVWLAVTHGPLKRGLVEVPPVPVDPVLLQARERGRAMSLEDAVAWAVQPIGDDDCQERAAEGDVARRAKLKSLVEGARLASKDL